MILSALTGLYDRLLRENPAVMPRPGWNRRPVHYALILRPDGRVAQLSDLRDCSGKRPLTREMLVPDHGQPRSGTKSFTLPYFLCDHTAFLLGAREGLGDKAAEYLSHSRALHERLLAGSNDPFAAAIRAFFARWDPAQAPALAKDAGLDWEKEVSGANLVFGLDDEPGWAHDSPSLKRLWEEDFARRPVPPEGQCLVTGQIQPIARLHAGIKLPGTTGNGAPVISFNADAFTSYGAEQGLNAPVGEHTAFAYAAALNTLIGQGSRRRLSFGDTVVAFWAESDATPEEDMLFAAFAPEDSGLDQALTDRVRKVLTAFRQGAAPRESLDGLDAGRRFFVLGIGAPGGSRVSVRFWLTSTFGELMKRLGAHQAALALEKKHDKDPDFPSFHALLRAVVPQGKDENIPGPLAAALAQAALTGAPYPPALLAGALTRMRTEHGKYDPVSFLRVALVKACLTRSSDWEPQEMLNPDDSDTAYRLGRLFAALERAQQLAHGGNVNATIKDRYFGAASSSPRAVFPNLIRLAQHHLSKAEAGWLDRLIGDIADELPPDLPATLDLQGQGRFAIGYYHQRNDLWRSRKGANAEETAETKTES